MINENYKKLDTPYYMEEIFVQVPPEKVEQWIANDEKYWGPQLASKKGVSHKEIWVSKDVPGNIRSIIYWSDYVDWKTSDFSVEERLDGLMMDAMDGELKMEFRDQKEQYIFTTYYPWIGSDGSEWTPGRIKGSLQRFDKPIYIEEIKVQVPPEKVEQWIENERQVWGKMNSTKKSLLLKEIWVSKDVPGNIRTFLYWGNYVDWKTYNPEEEDGMDAKMNELLDGQLKMEFVDRSETYEYIGFYPQVEKGNDYIVNTMPDED